ncbi:MAG: recombinase family protein, partial [Firmicutes bacterium]|nr:recombinase family protein [Bacillota bacterium]
MSYRIGMYLRLSEDDENEFGKSESNSISAQRAIIKEYIANQSELCVGKIIEFCDDGYSGVDFKRPSIQKLFEEVRKGTVNCIIVKDLSRFGRNHIEVGDYLEQIFPVLNVRFIAVNDRYDSNNNIGTAGTEVAFKNLMNENYSRDLSEKIKSVARINQSKGYFIGSVAPYGYKNVKKELFVDEETARVVKRIFEMADAGMKYSKIAQTLNKEGIYTAKEQRLGRKIGCLWEAGRISRILHDKVYIGTLVSN